VRRSIHRFDVAYDSPCGKLTGFSFDSLGARGVNEPAMYDTSDIRKGLKVLMDGNPYTVIEFQFVKPGKGAAFTRTKFKNLLTGAVVERNIRSGEKLEPANVETRDMQFLYKEANDLVFMDQGNYEQVTISKDLIGDAHDLMKDNLPCTVVFFNERPVDVTLPTFVFLEVTASEPGVKGDTSGNVTKPATLETGATVAVPLFIRIGDTIKIDTRTHEYVERVNKQ
jgi:elongation factor P